MKSTYQITSYTRNKAKRMGVSVRPSTVSGKKIDVFRHGQKIASCGALGYGDYPTFLRVKGKEYAQRRRKLYKQRHESDRHVRDSPGYWADQLLW